MSFTLDANVLVAAYRVGEPHRVPSRRFLDTALSQHAEFLCPVLVLPECAAPVARATGVTCEAEMMISDIRRLRNLRLVTLDEPLAVRAAEIAMTYRLRGADSVYVAVAELFDTTLLTWDAEMLERAPAVVPTMTPADWLALKAGQPG